MQKNVIVTGGTRGIGRAISQQLCRLGATVFANYLSDHESAESLSASLADLPGKFVPIQAHLGDAGTRGDFWSELDKHTNAIDSLVINAATGVHRPALDLSGNSLRKVLAVNLESSLEFCQQSVRRMKAAAAGAGAGERGRILAISSLGAERALPDYGSVGISKAALEALMRQLARELGPTGINCNIVRPGLVDTGILDYMQGRTAIIEDTIAHTPNRRLVTPKDVAQLVEFLLGPNSSMINGQTLTIDGGFGVVA